MTFLRFKAKFFLQYQTYPSIKNLSKVFKWWGGRNNTKKRAVFNKGTRKASRFYKMIDFKRLIWNLYAKILRFEYDAYRTSLIALICYSNGILTYILKIEGMKIGQRVISTDFFKKRYLQKGSMLPLNFFEEGSIISNLEIVFGKGGKLVRSAGTAAILVRKFSQTIHGSVALIRLPSREEIFLSQDSFAILGRISNVDFFFVKYYKAGRRRLVGYKPKVRGVARNPVDHPHGGGGGKCLVTHKALPAKNRPTRNIQNSFLLIVKSKKKVRRKKKRK